MEKQGVTLIAVVLAAVVSVASGLCAADATSAEKPLVLHVKPGGVEPFTDISAAPAVGVVTGGCTEKFWSSGGGSAEKPLATLFQAQLAVREVLRAKGMPNGGIRVVVHGGVYRLQEPLDFMPEDSGTPERPVVYEAAPGEKPVLSGGALVTGWKKLDRAAPGLPAAAKGKVRVAPAPEFGAIPLDFRQLYVNGRKAVRARTPNAENYFRLAQWDGAGRQFLVNAADAAGWNNLKRVELVVQQSWEISYLRLESVEKDGDKARLTFQQPERNLVFSRPYPWSAHDFPYHFVNALEFLDTPGEWYLDNKAGILYYWPRPGEEMAQAEAIAPRLETLARVQGTLERPVHDIQFRGLAFEHATWMRPTLQGHVAIQAGMYVNRVGYRISGGIPEFPSLDNMAWAGRPPAGVYVAMAHRIGFERCAFRNMASAALDLHYGTHDDVVAGCAFSCIGGNGAQMGKYSDEGYSAHLPFNPADERELCANNRFANNVLRDCGNEDWGCVGIAAGFVRGIRIEHNDVADLPYTGISVGWAWNPLPNCMRDNKILFNHVHDYMKRLGDGGGIYTLSNQTPSEIRGNYIHDLRRSPVGGGGCMIYLDEGSSGFLVQDNRTESTAYAQNKNGPGNRWENNGPDSKGAETAGLESAYQDLLK
jgi:hypothetical protein